MPGFEAVIVRYLLRGKRMRIELVGGSRCGEIVNVKYLDQEIPMFDVEGRPVVYRRRDTAWNWTGRTGQEYGLAGYRMYDYVRPEVA